MIVLRGVGERVGNGKPTGRPTARLRRGRGHEREEDCPPDAVRSFSISSSPDLNPEIESIGG